MENRRDDTMVIFAGYPDKMSAFLNKNPGLHSRIGFHVSFPDYSQAELFEILDVIASEAHMTLNDGVKEKLMPLFENARMERDFGNGRFVRNLFDKARLRQASRILAHDIDAVSNDDVIALCAEDFVVSGEFLMGQPQRAIGFGT